MRRRVLLLVAATTTLVLVAFLVPLAVLVKNVAADRAVQRATVEAQELTALVATTTDQESLRRVVEQVDAASGNEVTVFHADGTRLGAPAERSPLVELGQRGVSESAARDGGREIVFAVTGASGDSVIRTFVPDAQLSAGVPRAWLLLSALGVALLLVSLLVADRMARTFVRSTVDLAAVSHRLGRGELDARADESAPGELGVVAGALNGLAGRIDDLLREERETIADLSHRVRTPLTSLRLEADTLPPEAAERIAAGVDAVNRAVTEVIQQARRRDAGPESGATDATELVRDRVAFWSVLAEDTDRELTVSIGPGPLPVALGRGDLEACVDALLGNVFAHTPDGTAAWVSLADRDGGGARLVVEDAGPGLAPGHATGALRRGVSGSGSSGLGLDIVARAAERTGGEVRLETSAAGGLRVVVDFGALVRP